MDHKKPGSPGDILQHHGVKGQKWGVRKLDPTSNSATSSSAHQGLSDKQKVALGIGGTVVVGGLAYVAYKKYGGGAVGTVPLGWKHPAFALKDTEHLMVNTTKGYSDIRPTNGPFGGFKNAYVQKTHGEMIQTLDEFRAKYPAIRKMNVEVVPLSHISGSEKLIELRAPAAIMPGLKGSARIIYNDSMSPLTSAEAKSVAQMQPGQLIPKFIGNHEMGHLLAASHGELPPVYDMMTAKSPTKQLLLARARTRNSNKLHKELFKKHGLTFGQLSMISRYGSTKPSEALAELSGYYHTPGQQSHIPKEILPQVKALFDELGGIKT